ncbi:SusD-like protein P2 [Bacteroides finegoldii]|uniref:RagB/SusD domain-containing protein n=1 Tax=Bacteroides finegoldii CL09T03C10 TaxID=997888 RepID=K5D961_9BACE|nr:RagB/SusD family nutrient uptake outer membrane protein [Bacteroides finegoldii]EKJ89493.1 hypothetical protein HMPREF1057_03034 [Bacteroides finegoldii CL09T03C10]
MKLKRIIYGALSMALLASCSDQMNYHEYTNNDKEYIARNFGYVGGLITDLYISLDADFGNYSGAILGAATDEAEYAYTGNEIYDFFNGAWSPSNPKSSLWNKNYTAIAKCNQFMEEFTGLTFPELKYNADYEKQMFRYNNYQYEVRFLRAYFYFNLVRQYGDVPFTDHVMTPAEANTLSRKPAQEVFNYIIDECDNIKDEIIEDYSKLGDMALGKSETARANKITVLALKARTALYAASPLFNPENVKELWYRAAKANKELLDACEKAGMNLVSYASLFGDTNWQATSEIIFGKRNAESNSFESYNFPIGVEGGKGGNCPTQTLVDAYEFQATGLRPDETEGWDPNKPYYDKRDPRFALTIIKNGDGGGSEKEGKRWPSYNENTLQTYYGGANGEPLSGGTPTSYYLKKYCNAAVDLRSGKSTKMRHTWIIFRLGEVYLNYAESVYRYLDENPYATTKEFPMSAVSAINKVRARTGVNMPAFPDKMSKEAFWKKYKNERMVELAFEGHRFWDVRRWKEADKHFKSIDEMKITRNVGGDYNYERKTVNRQWDDKMYLFPIPQSERTKNPNLTQNPGW